MRKSVFNYLMLKYLFIFALLSVFSFATTAFAGGKHPEIPVPKLTGPLDSQPTTSQTKDYTFFTTDIALKSKGYIEQEFFMSGKANAYDTPVMTYSHTVPENRAIKVVTPDVPYKTRLVVRRPIDPKKFNGVVVVEWFNVSDGFDGEYFWVQAKDYLIREGYAYVGISAQDYSISEHAFSLKKFSPARYETLDVNGNKSIADDQLAYDIFAQAAQAAHSVPAVLDNMKVKKVIGVGMSQSGQRLGIYINYVHQKAPIYDSFLIQAMNPQLRDNLTTPVIKVLTETEATNANFGKQIAQLDTKMMHTWWVAGANHGDVVQRMGRTPVRIRDLGAENTGNDSCATATTRSRVPYKYVINAALYHLHQQMETGAIPPQGQLFVGTKYGEAPAVTRDEYGNVVGGIRLSLIDVPIARAGGDASECGNVGVWVPFSDDIIAKLYPTHSEYVEKVSKAVKASTDAGFLLPTDAKETIEEAKSSIIGTGLKCGINCLSAGHFRADFSSTGILREHTVYYNTVNGKNLLDAVDLAHYWTARGDSMPVEKKAERKYYYGFATAALQQYIQLAIQAQQDNRMTDTAAKILISQANNIINGLNVAANGGM